MEINELKNCKLIQSLISILHDYISRLQTRKTVSSTTPKEKYAYDILLSTTNIIDCLEQLHFTIEMLSGYRKRKNTKMNRHDYIVFMIENFYLRIVSIHDRTLRFTNLIFDIGLPERECRDATIIKNHKVRNTEIGIILKNLNKFISDYKETRNKIAHSEGFYDERLTPVQTYCFLIESDDLHLDKLKRYGHFYKAVTDRYIKEKQTKLKDIAVQMEEIIVELLDASIPIVEYNLSKLK
ncbi:MAG: hypothetical protein J0M05_11090 [Candidatus Kapabacteria bacterium]|nr:hypothetical protein [Candidatus Kapabacteria bacterium]